MLYKICVIMVVCGGITATGYISHAQQPHDGLTSPFEESYSKKLVSSDRNRAVQSLAYGASLERFFVIEVSSSVPEFNRGEVSLLEFSADGREVGAWLLSRRDPQEITIPFYGLIAGTLPQPNNEIIIIGKFENNTTYSAMKVGSDREVMWSRSISSDYPGAEFYKAALMPGGDIWIAGTDDREAVILKIDLEGNVKKKRSYGHGISKDPSKDQSRMVATFTDISAMDDDGVVIVGQFGEATRAGENNLSVWVMHCDASGNKEKEKAFPGRSPQIAHLGKKGDLIVLHDTNADITANWQLLKLNNSLEITQSQSVDVGEMAPFYPGVTKLADSRFVVVGGVCNEFRLREFGDELQLVSSLDKPLSGETGGRSLVVSNGNDVATSVKVQTSTTKQEVRFQSDIFYFEQVND